MIVRITIMYQKARETIKRGKETSMMTDLEAKIEIEIIIGTKRVDIVTIVMRTVIDRNIEVTTKASTANVEDLEVEVRIAQTAVINQSYHLI